MRTLYACIISLALVSCSGVSLNTIAEKVSEKGLECVDLTSYQGSCLLQGMAEYGNVSGDKRINTRLSSILDDFKSGQTVGSGSFISYSIGGTAAAEIPFLAGIKEESVIAVADSMYRTQTRNTDGVMVPAWGESRLRPDGMFIDGIFAITPFLLYAGLSEGNEEWVDYSAWIALKSFEVLRDSSTGLVHQARGVSRLGGGVISQDCWSRGNGWGSIALAALISSLPHDNLYYEKVVSLAGEYFTSVLSFQDADGLWHQEMTYPDSYQEISGSALMLYGIGTAIKYGILPESNLALFTKGLAGMLAYIDADGNVGNTCGGCLAVGDSSKEAYAARKAYWNEAHAFGPVLLALSAARSLGIKTVDAELGSKLTKDKAATCLIRMVTSRKNDIAWENDWAAFRIYSQLSPVAKVSSGIDYWGKSVDYPILDKWYELNASGGSYHSDAGEGYDFYVVGKNRGVGGLGIWEDGSLYVSDPYEDYEIIEEEGQAAKFRIVWPQVSAGNREVVLEGVFTTVLRSPYTRVECTVHTSDGQPAVLAAGLTTFGHPEVWKEEGGILWLHEHLDKEDINLHSILIVQPDAFAGSASYGPDRLQLMNVNDGDTVTYYFSAASNMDNRVGAWATKARKTDWESLEKVFVK